MKRMIFGAVLMALAVVMSYPWGWVALAIGGFSGWVGMRASFKAGDEKFVSEGRAIIDQVYGGDS